MMTIHNRSPITVALITTAGAFYINPSEHLKAPLRIRYNSPKSLHRTTVYIQSSMTSTVHLRLPHNNIYIVHFKTT